MSVWENCSSCPVASRIAASSSSSVVSLQIWLMLTELGGVDQLREQLGLLDEVRRVRGPVGLGILPQVLLDLVPAHPFPGVGGVEQLVVGLALVEQPVEVDDREPRRLEALGRGL